MLAMDTLKAYQWEKVQKGMYFIIQKTFTYKSINSFLFSNLIQLSY